MKQFIFSILFVALSLIIGFAWQNVMKNDKNLSSLALCNIEALADTESNPGKFNWCKTGSIVNYGIWVLHCGNCDRQMVSYETGEGYCYQK